MENKKKNYYEAIFKAAEETNRKKFRKLFLKLHVKDQEELFHLLYPEKKKKMEEFLDPAEFAQLFEWKDAEDQLEAYHAVSPLYIASLFTYMEEDNIAAFLSYCDEEQREELLQFLVAEERKEIIEILSYKPETAGSIMTKGMVVVTPEHTVQEAIEVIRTFAKDAEIVYYLYVLDEEDRLVGVVSLRDLILHDERLTVSEIMLTQTVFVNIKDDQEEVARVIQDYDLLAVPVLDQAEKMLGIITVDDIMDILVEEATEDFNEFSAISKSSTKGESAWDIARVRMPWIVVLVFLGMLSASLISSFEDTLNQVVILAAFILIIMDSAGNVGTQSLAVAVRNLSTGEERSVKQFWQNIWKEFLAGGMIGIVAGLALGLVAGLFYGNLVLGLVIGFSLFVTLSFSTAVGDVVQVLINKMNIDPAVASGPFITTINDAFGLLIYFSIATELIDLL